MSEMSDKDYLSHAYRFVGEPRVNKLPDAEMVKMMKADSFHQPYLIGMIITKDPNAMRVWPDLTTCRYQKATA